MAYAKARNEIVDTEHHYIANLQILRSAFAPLMSRLSVSQRALLNIEPILRVSSLLVDDLEKETSATGTASVFLKYAPFMKVYTYVKNAGVCIIGAGPDSHSHHFHIFCLPTRFYLEQFSRAQILLADLRQNSEFASVIAACERDDRCRGRTLDSFLILPVQRVPRYKLLLEALCKHSGGNNADLQAALAEVTSVAVYINEKIRLHENRMKVMAVQTALGGSVDIALPTRTWIYEGDLIKMCRRGPKTYRFFLFNDVLMYASRLPLSVPGRGAQSEPALREGQRRSNRGSVQDRLPGMGRTHTYHRSLDLSSMTVRGMPPSKPPMIHVMEIKSPQKSFLPVNCLQGSSMPVVLHK